MEWNTNKAVKELPEIIAKSFQKEADYLYEELQTNRLSVILIPAPKPSFSNHKIRIAESHNPEWYSTQYHFYSHFKRKRCTKALDRIRKNKDRDYKTNPFRYDARMRELILTRLVEGYVFEGTEIYPNQNVKKYFNKSIDDYIGEN